MHGAARWSLRRGSGSLDGCRRSHTGDGSRHFLVGAEDQVSVGRSAYLRSKTVRAGVAPCPASLQLPEAGTEQRQPGFADDRPGAAVWGQWTVRLGAEEDTPTLHSHAPGFRVTRVRAGVPDPWATGRHRAAGGEQPASKASSVLAAAPQSQRRHPSSHSDRQALDSHTSTGPWYQKG